MNKTWFEAVTAGMGRVERLRLRGLTPGAKGRGDLRRAASVTFGPPKFPRKCRKSSYRASTPAKTTVSRKFAGPKATEAAGRRSPRPKAAGVSPPKAEPLNLDTFTEIRTARYAAGRDRGRRRELPTRRSHQTFLRRGRTVLPESLGVSLNWQSHQHNSVAHAEISLMSLPADSVLREMLALTASNKTPIDCQT
jgi:hypothetical protein